MNGNTRKIRFFRSHIPTFECVPGCHDCCGPVTAASEEMAQLPIKSEAEHAAAPTEFACPYLGDKGCEVYADRPLICRMFGTTLRLLCPNGRRPSVLLDPQVEQKIFQFFATTRQVLL